MGENSLGIAFMLAIPIMIMVFALSFFVMVLAVIFPELCAWPVISYTAFEYSSKVGKVDKKSCSISSAYSGVAFILYW